MKNKLNLFVTLLILMMLGGACHEAPDSASNKNQGEEITGGNCSYKQFQGTATIEELRSNLSATSSQEKVVVRYVFEPDDSNAPESVKHFTNEVTIGKENAKRRKIKAGMKYQTFAMYEDFGTCAPGPSLYEFEKWLGAGEESD